MPLHIDYRPRDLDEFFGGDSIKNGINSVLNREDRPHAFLFSGMHGCGKTTLGRIVKKMLGCSDFDFLEINGAEASGIDTIRRLKNLSRFSPMKGPVKVFLIDEAHMCTGQAKDALLKELEEPPDHVFYILCTNQPEKLLPTIKSRCTEFRVGPLSVVDTKRLLNWILKEENIKVPDSVLKEIVKASEGIPRQAVKILDAVIDLDEEESALEVIRGYSSFSEKETIDLCRAIFKEGSNWQEVSSILQKIGNENPERIRQSIINYGKTVLLRSGSTSVGIKMAEFLDTGYGNGMAGIVYACWAAIQEQNVPF